MAVKKRGDGYVFTYQRGLGMTKPKPDAYPGKLYVLLTETVFPSPPNLPPGLILTILTVSIDPER